MFLIFSNLLNPYQRPSGTQRVDKPGTQLCAACLTPKTDIDIKLRDAHYQLNTYAAKPTTNVIVNSPSLISLCPGDMTKIDAAMETAQLYEADKATVMELHTKGEEQHSSGKHADSVATLGEARALLGIE